MRAIITITAVVFVALLLGLCTAADARECRAGKGGGGYWQYRLIDGKKCWYRGRERLDKDELDWAVAKTPAAKPKPAPVEPPVVEPPADIIVPEPVEPPTPPPAERKTIAELVVWPDPPAFDAPVVFGARWGDMPASPVAEPPEIVTRGIERRAARAFAYAPEPAIDEDYRAPAALMLVLVLMWLLMLPPILLVIVVLWRHRMDQIEVEPPRWRLVPWKS